MPRRSSVDRERVAPPVESPAHQRLLDLVRSPSVPFGTEDGELLSRVDEGGQDLQPLR